jgi:hypothetical protein
MYEPREIIMKADINLLGTILNDNETVLSSLYCSINIGYISRSGILGVTNEINVSCGQYVWRRT